jgi:cytoskeletal protein RodZ
VGSIVAALTATTIRTSVRRSHEAAVALATRRRTGMDPTPPDTVPVEVAEPEVTSTPWSGWARGAVTVAAAFALGIAGVLLVQLGLGRNLSPGTGQLQSAAAKVVVASPTATNEPPSATATTTVTETASATPSPSSTSSNASAPVTLPVASQTPTGSTTPSATPLSITSPTH